MNTLVSTDKDKPKDSATATEASVEEKEYTTCLRGLEAMSEAVGDRQQAQGIY